MALHHAQHADGDTAREKQEAEITKLNFSSRQDAHVRLCCSVLSISPTRVQTKNHTRPTWQTPCAKRERHYKKTRIQIRSVVGSWTSNTDAFAISDTKTQPGGFAVLTMNSSGERGRGGGGARTRALRARASQKMVRSGGAGPVLILVKTQEKTPWTPPKRNAKSTLTRPNRSRLAAPRASPRHSTRPIAPRLAMTARQSDHRHRTRSVAGFEHRRR